MFRLGVVCESANYQERGVNGQGMIKLVKTLATGLSHKNSDLCQISEDEINIIQYLQYDKFKKIFLTIIDKQFNIKQTVFDLSNEYAITSFKNILLLYDQSVKLISRQGKTYQQGYFKYQNMTNATSYKGSLIPLVFRKKFIYICSSKLKIIKKVKNNKTIYDLLEVGQKFLLHSKLPMSKCFEVNQLDFFTMENTEISLPTNTSKFYSQKNNLFCIEKSNQNGQQITKHLQFDWKGTKLSENRVSKHFSFISNFSTEQQYAQTIITVDDKTYYFKIQNLNYDDLVQVINFRSTKGEYFIIFRFWEYDQIYQFYP